MKSKVYLQSLEASKYHTAYSIYIFLQEDFLSFVFYCSPCLFSFEKPSEASRHLPALS